MPFRSDFYFGEYGGRNFNSHSNTKILNALVISLYFTNWIPLRFIGALSIIMTECRAGEGLQCGRSLNSLNFSNNSIVKKPFRIPQVMKPSTVYAGRIDQYSERLNSLDS